MNVKQETKRNNDSFVIFPATLKKKEVLQNLLWVLLSGKIQNPHKSSAQKGFHGELSKPFIIFYQKKVLSKKGFRQELTKPFIFFHQKMVLPKKGSVEKLWSHFSFLTKMVQSDTRSVTFKWFSTNSLVYCTKRFCTSSKVPSSELLTPYYAKTSFE